MRNHQQSPLHLDGHNEPASTLAYAARVPGRFGSLGPPLTVEILGQDATKAKELAAELVTGVTFGTTVDAPQGAIVVLAVPFDAAKSVVRAYGDALAGKTVVAQLVPASANVVKAFNTTFAGTLVAGESRTPPASPLLRVDGARPRASRHTCLLTGRAGVE
ncbi:putative dinucleotide-binding enzyme [Pseudarthrobacter oxydans]|uniref:NAD(P)-binding domain-containing protein n=1 Tax=Pseudarthrobacter oxydans TaxID=1671 RepID=UPI00277D8FB0|nr:NAD(P)-binding domain-containing protein [Pseudarthrobacter oxydans]MDP9983808.1 putative dinucleotide-binding enzyme [Pseudarthrobacter oxydans]